MENEFDSLWDECGCFEDLVVSKDYAQQDGQEDSNVLVEEIYVLPMSIVVCCHDQLRVVVVGLRVFRENYFVSTGKLYWCFLTHRTEESCQWK